MPPALDPDWAEARPKSCIRATRELDEKVGDRIMLLVDSMALDQLYQNALKQQGKGTIQIQSTYLTCLGSYSCQ
jgi:hypothetical protein